MILKKIHESAASWAAVDDARPSALNGGAHVRQTSKNRIANHAAAHARLRTSDTHIVASNRGGAMPANSIVNWFVAMFAELKLEGCSSHSGRRTFITAAARNVHRAGGSLRDVQLLAGHQSIDTTQRYIDGDTIAQRKLITLL